MRFFEPSARVIADSVSPAGERLTTMEVRFHRFLLAEFNTHRMFSRNSASSRAIPATKMIDMVVNDPAVPLSWPAARRGMQGGEELPGPKRATATRHWLAARDAAVEQALVLIDLGVHKSVVNRLLEPFLPHTVIVSATDWLGFFEQRCSPLAQPEIRALADAMRIALSTSEPTPLNYGDWHLPYITVADKAELEGEPMVWRWVSAARCARVSYLTHDGKRDIAADYSLYHRLVDAKPPHASPLEHVATPSGAYYDHRGNFTGWAQLRHEVLGR